ncbi:MAG: hypothetical protein IIB56_05610 [Planctomycetes bacterium]|nr:hypothetical protein [Planctomycetota bacterium]
MNQVNDQQSAPVRETIARGRRIMIANRLVLGGLVWVTVCFGLWLVLCFIDNLLHLPPGLRLAIVLGWAGLMIFEFWKELLSPILQLEGLEGTALLLERKHNVPENMLINALCFESREFNSDEEPFAIRTVDTAISLMSTADLKKLWDKARIRKWLIAFLIIMLFWMVYGISRSRYVVNAMARFIRPLADVPPAGSVVLKVTPGSDVTIAEADDLIVSVEVKGRGGDSALRSYPKIVWQEGADYVSTEKDKGKSKTMRAVGAPREGVFNYTFAAVDRPFAFRVFAADTYSSSIKVMVNAVPRIKESQFHISSPAYTGAGKVSTMGPPEAVSGLADSQVVVDVKLDKQAEGLWWKAQGKTIEFKNVDKVWRAEMQLQRAGSYQLEVKGPGSDRRIAIASGAILLQQDSVPEIEFVDVPRFRGGMLTVNPGERLKFDIRASDDFGIGRIYVTLGQVRANSPAETIKHWKYEGPPGRKEQVAETLRLSIDAGVFKPGYSYVLQAFCQDFSPMKHIGQSQPVTLQVRSLDELTISADDPYSNAFEALDKAIEAQQAALGVTENVLTNIDDVIDKSRKEAENIKSLQRHQGEMNQKQKRVGDYMTEAWDVSSLPRPRFVDKLVEFRDGEHARVMEKIGTIGVTEPKTKAIKVANKSDVSRSLQSVEKQQAFLLEQLISLKGVIAKQSQAEEEKAAAEILGESIESLDTGVEARQRRVGSNPLSAGLKEMAKELDEFIEKQKQIMQERQMIMDPAAPGRIEPAFSGPPEDFSTEEEDRLEDLAMDQSKLAEILSDVVNDFTNLDLLDFGDDAMVESMKSLYEEADELAEQARETADMRQARVDAHRLETEEVEMAEELMINCEATLGFYDNIQFIAEIPEDEQLFAPLAELPSELEDLVADLITTEEEMRPEVEDIGSYLNSLDHTAGPVSDGTISSTSAKGKTGDQRPEDNIIQGRSGAGRTGMSDGQLVEPVAKALSDNEYGLRERLSNTPLESGQVKDEDTKAQTGGTGLGKDSDQATMFGVGGKLPPKVLDMMKATEEKQLNIRQSAQELVLKLESHNLPTMELEKSIRAMKTVEESIKTRSGVGIRGAYDEAVSSLKKSHRALGRQIALQYTRDKATDRKLDDMLSRKQQYRFKGYEHMISAYFEALAQGKDR